ncbi:unnamed protein product [Orchesella dallaii]|uniref:BTB domain-containing protein n=1 Tax=Orchesella dallaii TaxID=48710 RepID=A0ABP1Q6A7_9HEXA
MSAGTDNIFLSCRKGDLARIQYLVEKKEIDLNIRDCWDSTPLYYACHCGHLEVVRYLLANGARCEENTFDGERCLYGALTNEIKRILLESKIANMGTQRRDDFDEFCEKLLTAEDYSDFTLRLRDNKVFKLHRCVLSARSPGLNSLLAGKWRDLNDVTNNLIDPKVFEDFVKFLYTGKLKCTRDQVDDMKQLAKRCRVQNMVSQLEHVMVQSVSFERSKTNIKVTTLVLDTPLTKQTLQDDFCAVIDTGIEEVFAREPFLRFNYTTFDEDEGCGEEEEEGLETYNDICLKVEGTRFYCNKVFLCTRSAYFQALLEDYFDEYHETCNTLPVINLRDVSASVISCVLYYIYTNLPHTLNEDIVFDVLEISDIYLLPGLKKHCGIFLCNMVSRDNVIELLAIARLRDIVRLEDRCADYLADNIVVFVEDETFHAFIMEDAQQVECRQETDSIPIIDDIRYHITSQVASFAELEESQEKLRLIDKLLDDLGLEA